MGTSGTKAEILANSDQAHSNELPELAKANSANKHCASNDLIKP